MRSSAEVMLLRNPQPSDSVVQPGEFHDELICGPSRSWDSGCRCGLELTPDSTDGEVKGASGEERVGRLGEDAADETAADETAAADDTRGVQLAPCGGGVQCLLDVDRNWAGCHERQPFVVRR